MESHDGELCVMQAGDCGSLRVSTSLPGSCSSDSPPHYRPESAILSGWNVLITSGLPVTRELVL